MKKRILIIVTIIFLSLTLVGCKKDDYKYKTCTNVTKDDNGYETNSTVKFKYKDNIIYNLDSTVITETDPKYLDVSIELAKSFTTEISNLKGVNVSINKEKDNKMKLVLNIDYQKLVKEELNNIKNNDSIYLKNTNINIDDFINENLKDYTCK